MRDDEGYKRQNMMMMMMITLGRADVNKRPSDNWFCWREKMAWHLGWHLARGAPCIARWSSVIFAAFSFQTIGFGAGGVQRVHRINREQKPTRCYETIGIRRKFYAIRKKNDKDLFLWFKFVHYLQIVSMIAMAIESCRNKRWTQVFYFKEASTMAKGEKDERP